MAEEAPPSRPQASIMNEKLMKKIRKANRRAWREYVGAICKLPFVNKLYWCWFILTHRKME